MALTVPRITNIHGIQPPYETSGFSPADVDPETGQLYKPFPTYPEMQPYSGFTNQHCYVNIAGQELTGYDRDPSVLTGPLEGDLMILFLHTRNGNYLNFGAWEPVGALNVWRVTSILPDGPVPSGLGSWTEFARSGLVDYGPKVVAYWKIATAAEANAVVRWRVRLNYSSERIFSNVTATFIRKGFFRTPFAPTVNTRTLNETRQFSVPGVTTPVTPDVDASPYNFPGGNLILSASSIMGQYDTTLTNPDRGIVVTPGNPPGGKFTYGGSYYYTYHGFWRWGRALFFNFAVGDNVQVPDSIMNIQKPNTPNMSYSGMTLAIPSPPNITMPSTTTPLSSYTNDFETNNLNSFFTVQGSGTPTLG